jgi:hypothetical protein
LLYTYLAFLNVKRGTWGQVWSKNSEEVTDMKKVISLLLVVCFIFIFSFNNDVYATSDVQNDSMTEREQEAKTEAYKQLSIFEDTLTPDSDFYYANFDNLEISDPFIIYIANQDTQDEVYYFPVYDKDTNKTIYVINVFSVDQRSDFLCEFSLAYNDALDQLGYIDNSTGVIAYRIGYSVYFETNNEIYNDSGIIATIDTNCTEKERIFASQSFDKKKEIISQRLNNLSVFVTPELTDDEMFNAKMNGYLTLYNPQYQYGYGMCWACAVATTCNYINNSSITGFNVCDAMGIGYKAGVEQIVSHPLFSEYRYKNCLRNI